MPMQNTTLYSMAPSTGSLRSGPYLCVHQRVPTQCNCCQQASGAKAHLIINERSVCCETIVTRKKEEKKEDEEQVGREEEMEGVGRERRGEGGHHKGRGNAQKKKKGRD